MFAPGLEASWVCIVVTSIGNREASIVGMFCNKRLKVAGFQARSSAEAREIGFFKTRARRRPSGVQAEVN